MKTLLRIILSLMLLHIAERSEAQPLLPVCEGKRWGYINTLGNLVVPIQFDEASVMLGKRATAMRNDSLFIIGEDGKIQPRGLCSRHISLDASRGTSLRSGKWALTDSIGQPLTAFIYDYVKAADTDGSYYLYSKGGSSGILNAEGREIIGPTDADISHVANGLFLLKKKKSVSVITLEGKSPVTEELRSVKHISGLYFQAVTTGNNAIFFHRDQGLILTEKQLTIENLSPSFLLISGAESRLFNTVTGQWCDSLQPPFRAMSDSLMIVGYEGFSHILHPLRGVITDYRADSLSPVGRYYRISYRGVYAQADQNLNLRTDFNFLSISKASDLMYLFRDTRRYYSVFCGDQEKFITASRFSNVIINSNTIKAYLPGNRLLVLDYDSTGSITDSMLFNNVVSVKVTEREQMPQDVSPVTAARAQPARNNSAEAPGWFWMRSRFSNDAGNGKYGLKIRRPGEDTVTVAIRPVFTRIRTGRNGKTIAINYYVPASPPLPVINRDRSWAWECSKMALINDSSGKMEGRSWDYIDETEVSGAAPQYRTVGRGQFHLLSGNDHRIVFKAAYISREENKVRRICKGGFISMKRPDNISYPPMIEPALTDLGINLNRNLVYNAWMFQGEWALLTSGLKIIRPEDAGPKKIIYISPFRQGRAIYYLDDGTCGMCDTEGKRIIPPSYHSIMTELDSVSTFFAYRYTNDKGVLDRQGMFLIPPVYQSVKALGEAFELKKGREVFLADRNGHIISLPSRSSLTVFRNGYGFIRNGGSYKIISLSGEINESISFSKVKPFGNGVAQGFKNSKWHLIDTVGNVLYSGLYEDAFGTGQSSALFIRGNTLHITGFDGRVKAKVRRVQEAEYVAPGVIAVNRKSRYALFSESGRAITRFIFRSEPLLTEGGVACISGKDVNFYDSTGLIVAFHHHKAISRKQLADEQARITRNGSGNLEIEFHPGQIFAATGDTTIESSIRTSIPSTVKLQNRQMVQSAIHDLYLGTEGRKAGYYASSGLLIVPAVTLQSRGFHHNVAIVKTATGFGLLGPTGEWLQHPGLKQITEAGSGNHIVTAGYTLDLYNEEGSKLNRETITFMQQINQQYRISGSSRNGWFNGRNGIVWFR